MACRLQRERVAADQEEGRVRQAQLRYRQARLLSPDSSDARQDRRRFRLGGMGEQQSREATPDKKDRHTEEGVTGIHTCSFLQLEQLTGCVRRPQLVPKHQAKHGQQVWAVSFVKPARIVENQSPVSRSLKAHLLLVLIAAIWGCTFVLVKAALGYATPLLFNALRMGLAAVLMLVLYRKQLFNMSRSTVIASAGVGLSPFLRYHFQTTVLALTTPSKSAFLTGSSNVMVPLILIAFWRTRIHLWRIAGIVAAFIGLFLMTVPAGKACIADFAKLNTGH